MSYLETDSIILQLIFHDCELLKIYQVQGVANILVIIVYYSCCVLWLLFQLHWLSGKYYMRGPKETMFTRWMYWASLPFEKLSFLLVERTLAKHPQMQWPKLILCLCFIDFQWYHDFIYIFWLQPVFYLINYCWFFPISWLPL